MSIRQILVVDDQRGVRVAHARMLESMGYSVDTASDGAEAISMIEQRPFDAIVSDLEMPVLGGLDLASKICSRPEWSHLKLVAVTGNLDAKVRQQALSVGYHLIITKPTDASELQSAIDQLEQ